MLQATTQGGELIIPSLLTDEEIKRQRKETFYCPQCKEEVILRAGPKTTPHFAHLPKSNCVVSHYGESKYHQQAKLRLFTWLQSHSFAHVYLEKYLPDIQQRPDLLLETKTRQIAVEFQSATISIEEINERNKGYAKSSIIPIWILGENQLRNNAPQPFTYRLNGFQQHFIKQYAPDGPTIIIYFCPHKCRFTILSDVYFYRQHSALAKSTRLSLANSRFSQLFTQQKLSKSKLYNRWYEEKKRFRLAAHRVAGKEYEFRRWLYTYHLHVEQLPSLIYLPIRLQHKMKVPLWHWQSKLVLMLLHPLSVGSTVSLSQCQQILQNDIHPFYKTYLSSIIKEYFTYLVRTRHFIKKKKHKWIKTRHFRFHRYNEQSVRADRLLMNYLQDSRIHTS